MDPQAAPLEPPRSLLAPFPWRRPLARICLRELRETDGRLPALPTWPPGHATWPLFAPRWPGDPSPELTYSPAPAPKKKRDGHLATSTHPLPGCSVSIPRTVAPAPPPGPPPCPPLPGSLTKSCHLLPRLADPPGQRHVSPHSFVVTRSVANRPFVGSSNPQPPEDRRLIAWQPGMKLLKNKGDDRVLDLLSAVFVPGCALDVASPG
jgi:hypothetical protein